MDKRFNRQVFETLDMPLESPLRSLRVFIDRCSAEFFVNDGEATFTTRSYPTGREFHYTVSDGAALRLWTLRPSVTDDFVV
jgi:sucrose-6-phosphate hydrolase SacC (GH32 family)